MRPNLEQFPQPPSGSALTATVEGDALTITNIPSADKLVQQLAADGRTGERVVRSLHSAAPSIAQGASCLGSAFQGLGILMLVFGLIFFSVAIVAVLFMGVPMNVNGKPADRTTAALFLIPFATVWIGFAIAWLYGVRRVLLSPDKLDGAWTLRLESDEWIARRAYSSKVIGRCRPQDIQNISHSKTGRVIAEVAGEQIPLTGPIMTSDRPWLEHALAQLLGLKQEQPPGYIPFAPAIDPRVVPGERLRHRLPRVDAPWRSALGMFGLAAFWNGITWGVGSAFIFGDQRNAGTWFIYVFLTLFAFVGLVLLAVFLSYLRKAMRDRRVGATTIEISKLPIVAGEGFEAHISQAGGANLTGLRVSLLCQEETTFTEGTTVRREIRDVQEIEALAAKNISVRRDRPYRSQFEAQVPADAMHSLEAERNKIIWKFRVELTLGNGAKCNREFPLVVHPAKAQSDAPDDETLSRL